MTALPQRLPESSDDAVASTQTLPGWTYSSAEFFELEKRHLVLATWQVVCHISDLPRPGDFATLDMLGERGFVVRGEDGELRAFHNVCRHRAAAVVRGETGSCRQGLRCFYHGWTYGLDGRLKAIPGEAGFPGLDKSRFGLKPLQMEVWSGFVFVRFAAGGSKGGIGGSVAERLAPYAREIAAYRPAEMKPLGRSWEVEIAVDWKNVMDNYLEGYHVPVGHPGLFRLFGNSYAVEVQPGNVNRAVGHLRDKESANWSERHYQRLRPSAVHLDAELADSWRYYTLLPNIAFDVYPEFMDFFHVVPVAPGRARLRVRAYGLPGADRNLRAARRLVHRVNRLVQREDEELIASVQAGLATSAYGSGYFSEKEACLQQFHTLIRDTIPVARLAAPPKPGSMADVNAAMG
jgi:phenylpropionate dioxygenase-like ring-hydroxylating dioxygenase large terminal subunit